jgi:hypothetical protein
MDGDGPSVDTALFPAFRRTLWVRSVPGWLVPERFLLDKSERTLGGETPARGNSVGKSRWCVAECAVLFGPICARAILFSSVAIYCHSQEVVDNSLACVARSSLSLIQSQRS